MMIQKLLYYVPDIFLLVVFPALVIMALPIKNNDAIFINDAKFILGFMALLWIVVSSFWLKKKIEILGGPIFLRGFYLRRFFTKKDHIDQFVKRRV